MYQERFRLDIIKRLFTERVVRHSNRHPKERFKSHQASWSSRSCSLTDTGCDFFSCPVWGQYFDLIVVDPFQHRIWTYNSIFLFVILAPSRRQNPRTTVRAKEMAYFHFEDVEKLDMMDAFSFFSLNTLYDAPGVIIIIFSVICQQWSRDYRT